MFIPSTSELLRLSLRRLGLYGMLHARASYFAQWPNYDHALQGQVEHLPFPFVLTAAFNQEHYVVDRLSPGYCHC